MYNKKKGSETNQEEQDQTEEDWIEVIVNKKEGTAKMRKDTAKEASQKGSRYYALRDEEEEDESEEEEETTNDWRKQPNEKE